MRHHRGVGREVDCCGAGRGGAGGAFIGADAALQAGIVAAALGRVARSVGHLRSQACNVVSWRLAFGLRPSTCACVAVAIKAAALGEPVDRSRGTGARARGAGRRQSFERLVLRRWMLTIHAIDTPNRTGHERHRRRRSAAVAGAA